MQKKPLPSSSETQRSITITDQILEEKVGLAVPGKRFVRVHLGEPLPL